MPLLSLRDIGKIYVSEGSVAVGIRGVNLSFERGEFVAVTGKSGSGKSTLLNVISGMDTYEEGELFIEGEPTSHYLQPDWEAYREKYVSFIFQDYNIIESFTVLENVELALLHIEDEKERRARAMELIRRVGLASHVGVKGSRLSGGQKQRTVIARALAKDSPIILADEPTGNLDAATSREIIALLREVSRDRLLIVVTHSFDEVAPYATRHVRVHDGAIESDQRLFAREEKIAPLPTATERERRRRDVRDGFTLGRVMFKAKPRLSLFLCLLMLIGTLGVFALTTLCGEAGALFAPNYMFTPVSGRVVLAKQSGAVFTEAELADLSARFGAESYLHFDALLDGGDAYGLDVSTEDEYYYERVVPAYGKDYGDDIIGRYPEADDEVLLSLPITYQPVFGKDSLKIHTVTLADMPVRVSGVRYYYDNNLTAECLFTEQGFRTATAVYYLLRQSNYKIDVTVTPEGEAAQRFSVHRILPSFTVEEGKIYVSSDDYHGFISLAERQNVSVTGEVSLSWSYYKHQYDRWEGADAKPITLARVFTRADMAQRAPSLSSYVGEGEDAVIVSASLLCEMAEEMMENAYRQASLFFASDAAAHEASEALQAAGYIAVPSDTTYEPDGETVILNLLAALMLAFVWVLGILFLAFFIHLCTTRSLGAFRGELAIMRSMGIPVKVIRVGMYARMLLCLVPAFIITAIVAVFLFTSPALNEYFVYLYAWQYALIALGMLLLTVRTTQKQIKKLFGESVKTALKGGAAE